MRVRIRALPRALRVFLVLAVLYWLVGAATLAFQAFRALRSDGALLQNAFAAAALACALILFIGTLIATRRAGARAPTRWLGAAPITVLALADMFASDFAKTGSWVWFTSGVLAFALIEFLSTPRLDTLTPASGVPRMERPAIR